MSSETPWNRNDFDLDGQISRLDCVNVGKLWRKMQRRCQMHHRQVQRLPKHIFNL